MKKAIVLCALSLAALGILHFLVAAIADYNSQTIAWMAPKTEAELKNNEYRGKVRLSQTEIDTIVGKLSHQIQELNQVKRELFWAIASIASAALIGMFFLKWNSYRFDGLLLFLLNLAVVPLPLFMEAFTSKFEEGNNATLQIRIAIEIVLLVLLPFLFYVAYRWNQHEIQCELHHQKWISMLALALVFITALVGVFLAIGMLFFTFNFSGGIS